MPDTPAPALAQFDAAAVAALTPEARATFAASLQRAGFAKDAVAAKLAPSQQSGAGSEQPPKTETVDPLTKHGSYSAADAKKAYDNWLKLGLPEDRIKAALEADGFAHVDDERSEAETAFDGSALAAAQSPDDYHLSYVGRPSVNPNDLIALDAEMREAFAAASVPAALAQGLLDSMLDGLDGWAALQNDAQRSLYKVEQKAMLAKVGDVGQMTALAAHALSRFPKATRDEILAQGCLESAVAVQRLASIGGLILHRDGLKAQRGR